jgi:hypothetical protein
MRRSTPSHRTRLPIKGLSRLVPLFALALVSLPASLFAVEWGAPENLGAPINSAYGEWYPVLARDGSFMVFVSDRPGGYGELDIYISRRVGGAWQEPENLGPSVNTSAGESAPFLAENDSVLYFASLCPGGHGVMDIYWCRFHAGAPGPKTEMPSPVNGPQYDCCPVLSPDGNAFYTCSTRPGGFGSMDVWMFEKSGEGWGPGVNLGSAVNTAGTDCPRWISDDGATLVVASTRTDGHGGADLWTTTRVEGTWEAAVNMGDVLNTAADEWGPGFLGNEGTIGGTIFLGSARAGGLGGRDIWMAAEIETGLPAGETDVGFRTRASPNPARGETVIRCAAPAGGAPDVSMRIYDIKGRLIRTLYEGRGMPSCCQARWDGATDSGARVPPGVYLCRTRTEAEETSVKIVLTD